MALDSDEAAAQRTAGDAAASGREQRFDDAVERLYCVAVSTNGNTIFLAPGQPRQSFPCQPAIGQTYGVLH